MLEPNSSFSEVAMYCRTILSSLDRLLQCLEGLNAEQLNWRPLATNANSLSVLVVHTLGNAEENILSILYAQPGQRKREQEFQAQDLTVYELKKHWQALRGRLQSAILGLTSKDLEREFIHPRRGSISGREILLVVARHVAEHLGQAELTRDLLFAATTK